MKLRIFLFIFSALGVAQSHGQESSLTLFEATDEPEQREQQTRQPQRARERSVQPAFTLKGTSRFGDDYRASLLSRDGQAVRVNWKPGRQANVQGHAGYSIVDIQSRTVSLQLPADEICIESSEKGVACSSGANIAVLTLSTAEPLARQPAQTEVAANGRGAEGQPPNEDGAGEVDETFINPFSGEAQTVPQISDEERAARAERAEDRRRALQNFQPVRISPDEVPAGMRVVSTPFGDRLVPDED